MSVVPFNPSLGSLESVTLSLADNANIVGTLLNKSASARDFNISEDVLFKAAFNGQTLLSNDLNASKSYSQLASGSSVAFGQYSLSGNSGTTTIIDPTMLASLTGTTPLSFNFSTLTGTVIGGGGGNTTTSFTTKADATLTITYNFITNNVVPEPASVVMTALGGLLIGSAGYVRSRAQARAKAGR